MGRDLGADGVDRDQAQRAGKNGGFLRVCGVPHAHVGTVMLEHMARIDGNASMCGRRRQLERLRCEGGGGVDALGLGACAVAQAGGVAPPSAARQIPRPLAHAIFPISIEAHFHACPSYVARTRQGSVGQIESGWKSGPFDPRPQTGRGVIANWGLRRFGRGNVGGARVN
ncbi:hypothetical protein [Sphingobium sp. YG1]|uniref:hypothetical protein n=1 Tax=Sphingobium sp. YG1 TaxID=2082188 RepID=UPI0011AE3EA3|nr:hypothetical protein [Sphingobium sp. YG1]